MRKFVAVFALLVVGVMPAFAAKEKYCGETQISFDGNQHARDDEFLYDSEVAYNSVKDRADGGTVKGWVYECDKSHCTNGTRVTVGVGHWFDGSVRQYPATYECKTWNVLSPNDRWELFSMDACPFRFGKINTYLGEGVWYTENGRRVDFTPSQCLQFHDTSDLDQHATKFNARCESVKGGALAMRCVPTACPSNMELKNGRCEEKGKKDDDKKDDKKDDDKKDEIVPPSKPSCQTRRTTAEGKACCTLPKEDAVWTGTTDSDPAGKCVCTNNRTEFKIQNGRGACVAKEFVIDDNDGDDEDGGRVYKCPESILTGLRVWARDADTPEKAKPLISALLIMCDEDAPDEEEVNNLWYEIVLLIHERDNEDNGNRVDVDIDRERTTSKIEINRANDTVQSIVAGFGRSVWRDKDGNFNKARLISDGVASVVLGTVGAVVTSNVIKKSQLKKGFEDISCSIGGQTVAAWGDEFNVGLK